MGSKAMTSTFDALKIVVGKRWRLMAALFVIEVAMIIFVSNSGFFPGELASTQKQYNDIKPVLNQSAVGQVASIFANNFRVGVLELIPLFGPAIFALSIYETARVVEVIGISNGEGLLLALGTLFFLPSTWLELPAYSIAVSESCYLLYAIYAGFKNGWGVFIREMRFLFVSLILIAGVLIVAAAFEVTEIQIETLTAPPAPAAEGLLVFLTWVPFALVLAGALAFWRRAKREAPELEARENTEVPQSPAPVQSILYQGPPQSQVEKNAAGSPTYSSRDEDAATA
jgi:uncharacterized membrane protein SpoIIM required for sporulation